MRPFATGAMFVWTLLSSAAAIRVLARAYPIVPPLSISGAILFVGIVVAWSALRRWRWGAPILCAAVVGLASSVAGAAVYFLLAAGLLPA